MTDHITVMTITECDNEVAVTGDNGTGDIGSKEGLALLCKAVATAICANWHQSDWHDTAKAAGELIRDLTLSPMEEES